MKPTNLITAEHGVVVYFHSPEFGVSMDDILKPDYWTHVAPKLRRGHRIEILAGDGSYWAMLLVRATGRHEAVVQALQHVALGSTVEVEEEVGAFEVKWRGPSAKFGVVRKDDKAVIKDGFELKDQAGLWLRNHLKSMAA